MNGASMPYIPWLPGGGGVGCGVLPRLLFAKPNKLAVDKVLELCRINAGGARGCPAGLAADSAVEVWLEAIVIVVRGPYSAFQGRLKDRR